MAPSSIALGTCMRPPWGVRRTVTAAPTSSTSPRTSLKAMAVPGSYRARSERPADSSRATSRPPRPNASAKVATAPARTIPRTTMRIPVEIATWAAAVTTKTVTIATCATRPSETGKSIWWARRSTRSRARAPRTTPARRIPAAARSFGRKSTASLSVWSSAWSPSSDRAEKTTTTETPKRTARPRSAANDEPRPARSSTRITPQRVMAASAPALSRSRRTIPPSSLATSSPTRRRTRAPPRRGRNPPRVSPARSRMLIAAPSGRRGWRTRRPPPRRAAPRGGGALGSPAATVRCGRPARSAPWRAPAACAAAARGAPAARLRRGSSRQLPVVGVPPHDVDELAARPEEPALDRAERRLGDLGDLLVRQALQVAEDEHRPVLRAQLGELRLEALAPLGLDEHAGGLADILIGGVLRAPLVLQGQVRLRAPARECVQGRVVGDPQKPTLERTVAPVRLEPVEGPEQGVLRDVVGVGGPHDAGRHAVDAPAMARHQPLKGAEIPRAHAVDQGDIRFVGQPIARTRIEAFRTM